MARSKPLAEDLLPLTPVVLHILLALADGARHGYGIAQDVEELTEGQVRLGPGTLYGSLLRMVKTGLIDHAAAGNPDPDDERRRYYRITPFGRKTLELELQRMSRVVAHARRKELMRAPRPA